MGKNLLPKGDAFIGSYNSDLFVEGKLYVLQNTDSNYSYSFFEVKYDYQNDLNKGLTGPAEQKPF